MANGQTPRDRMLAAASRLLEDEGPGALQARRLASEIGASTMAVYTHFGGLPGLRDALVREGLTRFAAHVRTVPPTDDAMADLIAQGVAYSGFALGNPQLYRLIFGLSSLGRDAGAADPWTLPEGIDTVGILVGSVQRVVGAGRIRPVDARLAATQILSMTHGFVLLAIGGFIGDVPTAVLEVAGPMTVNLMVGLGDERAAAERSFAAAMSSFAA